MPFLVRFRVILWVALLRWCCPWVLHFASITGVGQMDASACFVEGFFVLGFQRGRTCNLEIVAILVLGMVEIHPNVMLRLRRKLLLKCVGRCSISFRSLQINWWVFSSDSCLCISECRLKTLLVRNFWSRNLENWIFRVSGSFARRFELFDFSLVVWLDNSVLMILMSNFDFCVSL